MEDCRFSSANRQQLHHINLTCSPSWQRAHAQQQASSTSSSTSAAMHKGTSRWTVEEDRVLVDYIAGNGAGNWDYLASAAGLKNRTGRSCRLRWLNYLRPDLRHNKMTAEEAEVIVRLHSQWGNKWSKIAKQLPGRTEYQVSNFWRTNIQKQQQQEETKKKRRQQKEETKKQQRRQHDDNDKVKVDNCGTPATTEGQGRSRSSSSSSNPAGSGAGGGTTTTRVVDKVIVPHQQPSMCCSVSVKEGRRLGDQQVPPEGTPGRASAAAMDMDFSFPDLAAAPGQGKYFDFWLKSPSCSWLGNNDS